VEKQKKGRKKLHLFGALALALLLTGGLFAYTYTTANIALGMTAKSDIASVATAGYNAGGAGGLYGLAFGKYKGDLPEGNLFSIDPLDDYTGDLTIKVSIMNPGELARAYQYFNMKLALTDAGGTVIIGAGAAPSGHEYQVLSLENGVVEFDVAATLSQPYYVKLMDGGFSTFGRSPLGWGSNAAVDPQLFCEVVARK
jgi:hypothetical protein